MNQPVDIVIRTYAPWLIRSIMTLSEFVGSAIRRDIEINRIAHAAYAIYLANSCAGDKCTENISLKCFINAQGSDGGWSSPEETAWVLGFLPKDSTQDVVRKGITWLKSVRQQYGGWGRHSRDRVRIPVTALVISLVPEAATELDWARLRNEWSHDLERPIKLSYKGAFYLLAERKDVQTSRHDQTIRFLESDQNDDGGFGPWKNHPIGSDPWSTGVVLWGLSRWSDHVNKTVVEKALAWLEKSQLPSGYWPYHYLDEGTSYALIGAISALKALQRL